MPVRTLAGNDLLEGGTDLTTPEESTPSPQEPSKVESEAEIQHAKLFVENKYPPPPFAGVVTPNHSTPVRAASQLTDRVIPLDSFPQQPEPPLQIRTPFLETGPMSPPFELPTGAVWQPWLMAFGTVRTAVQTFDNGVNARISEWTNQASLYANLQLTGTERVLVEFRPLDNYQHYFGQEFEPHRKFHDREYGDLREAFFEGDFHQLFPRLDPYDRYGLDYGFSIGRQPLLLQDGLLLDDTIDSVGVIRNHILSPNFPPLRVTGYFGWDQIHRANNQRDNSARLVAVDASADDYTLGIIDLDAVYVPAGTKQAPASMAELV
jgi:hypothetical protein